MNRYASEGTCKLLVGNKSDRHDKVVSTEKAKVSGCLAMAGYRQALRTQPLH